MSSRRVFEGGDSVRELWTPLYFEGFRGSDWQGFQLDLGQDVAAGADHARWIADDSDDSDDGADADDASRPVDTSRQLPLPGVRADSRTRSIVFRALRLVNEELPTGQRGVGAARLLVNGPLPSAWDRRVANLEGRAWKFLERLVHASDLKVVWTEKTVQAAMLRLHEVCPDLFVRVNREEYLIPYGDLRDPESARLARLEVWCREVETRRADHEIRARSHDISAERLRRFSAQLRPGRRGYTGASAFPRAPQVNPEDAREAAAHALERLGPAVQGEAGDHRTFRAACIGDDFGLTEQEFRPLLEAWNENCEPPWPPRQLERKLGSAHRNRKRPVGYRLQAELAAPSFVSPSEVSIVSLWAAALSLAVPSARAARVWAERRGLDAQQLLERDLVRVLSPIQPCPSSCRIGGASWTEAGYRLLLPVFDHLGEFAGLRARHVDGPDAARSPIGEAPQAGAHELMPARAPTAGLCFADETGRALLHGSVVPTEIWVGQNGPDFLTLTDLLGQTDDRAVLGVFPGSWTPALAARLPDGARVVLATQASRTGDAHARRIAATLVGRCDVLRLILPAGTTSLNEAHRGPARFDLTAVRAFDLVSTTAATATATTAAAPARGRSPWERRALGLLQKWSHGWDGPARELARTLLLTTGERVSQAAVRGLERALVRLRERGGLPPNVHLATAWPSPVAHEQLDSMDLEVDAAAGEVEVDAAGEVEVAAAAGGVDLDAAAGEVEVDATADEVELPLHAGDVRHADGVKAPCERCGHRHCDRAGTWGCAWCPCGHTAQCPCAGCTEAGDAGTDARSHARRELRRGLQRLPQELRARLEAALRKVRR